MYCYVDVKTVDEFPAHDSDPSIVIVTCNYGEMMAVEAMMTYKTVYMKTNQIGK